MIWITTAATLTMLLGSGALLDWRARSRNRRAAGRVAAEIGQLVMLIQGTQKHRGLGGQQAGAALRQREQLAYQLDRQWTDWLQDASAGGESWQRIGAQLHAIWLRLRAAAEDFDAHSQLIERLLGAMALRERQLIALDMHAALVLAPRCREIEDLARLRGLSARAANHPHCPIELAVPLRYLCQCVAAARLHVQDPAVRMALKEIEQKLLDTPRVQITAARCFELLTPSIDRALDELRKSLSEQAASAAVPVRREAIAPLLPLRASIS